MPHSRSCNCFLAFARTFITKSTVSPELLQYVFEFCPIINKLAKWAFLVVQMVKNLLAVWDTQVQSLGQEDPLEKEMATHSSVLAWRIPGTAEPGGLPSLGSHRVRHD